MKQQIRAELKQGIVRRWYLYILPFALGAVSTAAFLNRYALLEAWTGELRAASFGDCFAYIFRGMQEYIPNQHQPFEVPVLFLLINILLAVLIGGYAAGELHGTGLNKLVRCQRRSDWWICKCIWNVISVLGYYAALIVGAVTAAFIASVKPGGASFFSGIAPHKEVVVKLLFCENPDKLNEKMLCCMVFVLHGAYGKLRIFRIFYERVLAGELYDALPYETGQCKRCGLADRHFDKSFSHSRRHSGGGISFWQI